MVFASPATKGVCLAPPLIVPPPRWRPLMAKHGYAFDTHLPPLCWTITGGTGPYVLDRDKKKTWDREKKKLETTVITRKTHAKLQE